MNGFGQHFKRLSALLRRRGRSRHDAEDLIQEAFLRLHVYCQTKEVREPEGFLVRTALNLSIDAHRKDHAELYAGEPLEKLSLVDLKPRPDEELAAWQRLDEARRVLDSLNPRSREIFLMHRLDGYGCAQIATRFGISVSAVEKHIARAVLALMDVAEHE